jgi:hypothetical protein
LKTAFALNTTRASALFANTPQRLSPWANSSIRPGTVCPSSRSN